MSPSGPDPAERRPTEDDVARLLGEAGGPQRMPEEVAARLDAVIADLAAERSAQARPELASPAASEVASEGAPIPLRRGRVRWPRVLLAAAAVVVAGVGVGTLLPDQDPGEPGNAETSAALDGSAESGEADVADGADGADGRAGALTGPETDADDAPPARLKALPPSGAMRTAPVRLRPDRLAADVRRALAQKSLPAPLPSPGAPEIGTAPHADSVACPPPALSDGETWTPARYAGQPAVLVTTEPSAVRVEAVVYSCAGERLDGVTVRRR